MEAMKHIRQNIQTIHKPTKSITNPKDNKDDSNSTSEMPGLLEQPREEESSDDDSDNDSENTYHPMPSLVHRKRNDSNSSIDNSNSHTEYSESDSELDEWNVRSDQCMNLCILPPTTIQMESQDFADSDSDKHSIYSEMKTTCLN